jgi:hypothetical protein
MAKKVTIDNLPDTPYNREVLREIAAYDAMWEDLLKTHKHKFVAIQNEQLVDSDDDEDALIERMFKRFQRKPFYIEQVLESRYRVVSIPGIDSE